MLIYLDANCFNRPFDDQTQSRIHRETDAVFQVLQRILQGVDDLVWSSALKLELSAHPEPEVRAELTSWAKRSRLVLTTNSLHRARVQELVGGGLRPLDAAHIHFAEAAKCAFFLTCDDRLLRQAKRLALPLRVINPVEYMEEVTDAGSNDR